MNAQESNLAARNAAPVVGSYVCDDGYAVNCPDRPGLTSGAGHCWHQSAARRFAWQGGPSEAANDDVAAWNSLGARREQAA